MSGSSHSRYYRIEITSYELQTAPLLPSNPQPPPLVLSQKPCMTPWLWTTFTPVPKLHVVKCFQYKPMYDSITNLSGLRRHLNEVRNVKFFMVKKNLKFFIHLPRRGDFQATLG